MSKNNAYQQEARDSSIAGFQERQLVVNSCAYFVHPIYNLYAASRDGKIIHIIKQVPNTGNKNHNGYMRCMVRNMVTKIAKHILFIVLPENAFMVLYLMVKLLIM